MEALYRIEHETRYVHPDRATTSQHVACLRPRPLDRQTVRRHELVITPAPDSLQERVDFFGNRVHYFEVLSPYSELRVVSRSVVGVRPAPAPAAERSWPWEQVRDLHRYRGGALSDRDIQFAFPSPYVPADPALAEFARPSFPPGRPLVDAAIDLMHRIHAGFRFDPDATSVATPVLQVLADRHGVCQDFAHLMIGCVQSLGIPARYVSGYLLTDPPPGQPRLTGADASHAWLAVRDPHLGWIDLDPTNDVLPGLRHITTAWGRDYDDVSPLRGVVTGGQQQRLDVAVTVTPAAGEPQDAAAPAPA